MKYCKFAISLYNILNTQFIERNIPNITVVILQQNEMLDIRTQLILHSNNNSNFSNIINERAKFEKIHTNIIFYELFL